MTTDELHRFFNDKFGTYKSWPSKYEVDHETYANVCQTVFDHLFEQEKEVWETMENEEQQLERALDGTTLPVAVGSSKGILFKNVELILKR